MPSPPDAEAELVGALHALGAKELVSVFMFPQLDSGRRQWCYYARTAPVRWRGQTQSFYVRGADGPFNIVPFRDSNPKRGGIWFSLGEGLDAEGNLMDSLLLVQLEGLDEQVDGLRSQTCSALESQWNVNFEHRAPVPSVPGWMRCCLAASTRSSREQ